jgi:hypothetical protein
MTVLRNAQSSLLAPRQTVAQKAALPGLIHVAFIEIGCEPELPLKETGDTVHHPMPGLFAGNVDVTVVSVAAEAMAPTFKFSTKLG